MFGRPVDEHTLSRFTTILEGKLDVFNKILGKQEYMGGDTFSLIDIFYMPYVGALFKCGCEDLFTSRENFMAWWGRVSTRDSWKKTMPTLN